MKPTLCPQCLNVLPDGYPFDHVAIDRALAGDTSVLAAMPPAERRELVLDGRRRGLEDWEIAALVHRSTARVRRWVANETGRRPGRPSAIDDAAVRRLWQAGLSDRAIAGELGAGRNAVFLSRRRQGLEALFTSGGQPGTAVAA